MLSNDAYAPTFSTPGSRRSAHTTLGARRNRLAARQARRGSSYVARTSSTRQSAAKHGEEDLPIPRGRAGIEDVAVGQRVAVVGAHVDFVAIFDR